MQTAKMGDSSVKLGMFCCFLFTTGDNRTGCNSAIATPKMFSMLSQASSPSLEMGLSKNISLSIHSLQHSFLPKSMKVANAPCCPSKRNLFQATGKILEKRKHSQIRVLEILEVRQEGKPILTTDLFHRTAELFYDVYAWQPGKIEVVEDSCPINIGIYRL